MVLIYKNDEVSKMTKKVEQIVEGKFDADSYIKECGSVSVAIRKLNSGGKSRSEIAKLLNKRYQHVRNVLITPIKKG